MQKHRAWLITQFHWILYVFGAFLVFTGIKMWWAAEQVKFPAVKGMASFLKC